MGTCCSCHQTRICPLWPTMIMSHDDNGNTVNPTATHVLKVEASLENSGTMNHLGFEMTTCLCMTNLLTKLNLWREDIKYSYPFCIVQVKAGFTAEASEFGARGVKAL